LEILSQNKAQGRSVISAILLIINIYIFQHSFCFFIYSLLFFYSFFFSPKAEAKRSSEALLLLLKISEEI